MRALAGRDSAELAEKYAYAPPVSAGSNAAALTREYETNARNIARSQLRSPRRASRTSSTRR